MTPVHDPDEAAIFRYLTGSATPPAPGERPSPAHMPRRIQPPRTAADIARAENLNLGDLPRPRREARPPSRRPRTSVLTDVLAHLQESGCRRGQEAYRLAQQWLEVEPTLHGVRRWTSKIGPRLPHAAAELVRHGLETADLDMLIDGTPAHRRLRNGEAVGQVVAALLILRRRP